MISQKEHAFWLISLAFNPQKICAHLRFSDVLEKLMLPGNSSILENEINL